jgi:NitT/TauT family transport system ATP-binding protein
MTPRPGRIAAELAVDLPQPRERTLRSAPAYAAICASVSARLAEAMATEEA